MKKGRWTIGLVLGLLVACGEPGQSTTLPKTGTVMIKKPMVELEYISKQYQRPPQVKLFFEAILRNEQAEPRWFILPDNIDRATAATCTTNGLEVWEWSGKNRVIVGQFLGEVGIQVFHLPAGAELKIHYLALKHWGELPASVNLEAIIARQIMIDGQPIESWFEVKSLNEAQAEVKATDTKLLSSKYTSNLAQVPLSIDEESRVKLPAQLVDKN